MCGTGIIRDEGMTGLWIDGDSMYECPKGEPRTEPNHWPERRQPVDPYRAAAPVDLREYHVEWSIDLQATSHIDAARIALQCICDESSTAHTFNVCCNEETDYVHVVMLDEIDKRED